MCLIGLAWHAHPDYPLVIAANRDEAHQRPTDPSHWWNTDPAMLGGRDRLAGGTWLALRADARWAAVTNYREVSQGAATYSRGRLPTEFVLANHSGQQHIEQLHGQAQDYAGFNLLAFDRQDLWWYSNRADTATRLEPGIHGLSNHLINTPWPKVRRVRQGMAALLQATTLTPQPLLQLLGERHTVIDDSSEQADLSGNQEAAGPLFISAENYGSRASTVVLLRRDGWVSWVEHSFGPMGQAGPIRQFSWHSGLAIGPGQTLGTAGPGPS